jgi:hypothetical protein
MADIGIIEESSPYVRVVYGLRCLAAPTTFLKTTTILQATGHSRCLYYMPDCQLFYHDKRRSNTQALKY